MKDKPVVHSSDVTKPKPKSNMIKRMEEKSLENHIEKLKKQAKKRKEYEHKN